MRATGVSIGDGVLEVIDLGVGDPVLFVQTGLTADELLPLALDPAVADFRRIVAHRRGYAGSSAVELPHSIDRDVADCAHLLDALGIERAQVVGYSYSGAVALQLAADRPERVSGLALIEPPPTVTSYRDEFVATVDGLLAVRRASGVVAALDAFWDLLGSAEWWQALETHVPDARAQMRADAATFFDADLPALLEWEGGDLAGGIACPVLYVGGDASGPWWEAVRKQVLAWFPEASVVMLDGADHGLAVTHASDIAAGLRRFWDGDGSR